VAADDFNGDGKLDLAVTIQGTNSVAILLGNGNGTFAAPVSYAVGTVPFVVATGDFNGDGKRDLAVSNEFSHDVSILLGNGNGTFAPAVSYPTPAGAVSVVIADFNGDGKSDLAVADEGVNVAVLLGNGNGTFGPATGFTAGSDPFSVAAADFNSDGRTDLAVANFNSNDATVLLNLSVCAAPPADLRITKTLLTPPPIAAGTNVVYAIAVSNAGPGAASGVVVTDVLPPGAALVSATPSQGSCSGTSTVSCALGSLANGAAASITLVMRTSSTPGSVSNIATVSAPQSDPTLSNNASTATATTVDPLSIPALPAWGFVALGALLALLGAIRLRSS